MRSRMSGRGARAEVLFDVAMLIGVAISLALALSGCGMSQLERHTTAAVVVHGIAKEAGAIIQADTVRAAEEAIAPCRDGGADAATCEAALADAMRPRRRAAAVFNLLAAAAEEYVGAVRTAIVQGTDVALSMALRALSRVLAVYDELVALLAEYGVPLPDAGPLVRGLLGGAR